MQDYDLIFGRNDALAIRTTFQEALYDVINSPTYKEEPWQVEVVVNARTDNSTVFVVGLIPTNVVHYVRKSKRYKDQRKL